VASMDISLNASSTNVSGPGLGIILPDLWSLTSTRAEQPPIASTSFLLGDLIPPRRSVEQTSPLGLQYMASASSLFGPRSGAIKNELTESVTSSGKNALDTRYRDIVNRIHSTLVTAPSVPLIAPPELIVDPDVLVMPTEMPFVPASQRTTLKSFVAPSVPAAPPASDLAESNETDSIVVVGRKMKKSKLKRKIGEPEATTQVSDSGTGDNVKGEAIAASMEAPGFVPTKKRSGLAKAKSVDDAAVEPFDYSSVPNLLDAGDDSRAEPEAGGSSARKSKKLKTGKEKKDTRKGPPVLEYGNFPAPPRNRAEPRSGNMSHTFR